MLHASWEASGPHGGYANPPMWVPMAHLFLFVIISIENTPWTWTCGTSYLIKYAQDMLVSLHPESIDGHFKYRKL